MTKEFIISINSEEGHFFNCPLRNELFHCNINKEIINCPKIFMSEPFYRSPNNCPLRKNEILIKAKG